MTMKLADGEGVIAPVTAVLLLPGCNGNYALSGRGSWVGLHDCRTGKQVALSKVIAPSCIHGFEVSPKSRENDWVVAVFGQKNIAVISVTPEGIGPIKWAVILQDWIWALTWLETSDPSGEVDDSLKGLALAVVNGHNFAQLLDFATKEAVIAQSEEHCMLYSAETYGTTKDSLIVASGTIFSEILLWRPFAAEECFHNVPVFSRLKGHDGVIFSISFSPLCDRLVTASDDRSVRIWDLANLESPTQAPVRTLYQHRARIWNVKFAGEYIVSASEDNTLCVWDLGGNFKARLRGHNIRGIWSLDVRPDCNLALSGGNDGGMLLWSIHPSDLEDQKLKRTTVPLPILSPGSKKKVFPRRMAFLGRQIAVAISNEGGAFSIDVKALEPRLLFQHDGLVTANAIATSESYNLCCCGTVSGEVFVFGVDDGSPAPYTWSGHAAQIVHVAWGNRSHLFTASLEEGTSVIKMWDITSDGGEFQHKLLCELNVPEGGLCQAVSQYRQQYILCGTRKGAIHVFDWQSGDAPIKPLETLQAHGKKSATDILVSGGNIRSCGRDGYVCELRYWRLTKEENRVRLSVVSKQKPDKKIDWVDSLQAAGNETITAGCFLKTDFVLLDLSSGQQILKVPCGGGHRSTSFTCGQIPASDSAMCFARDCVFHIHSIGGSDDVTRSGKQHVLLPSFHGRESVGLTSFSYDKTGFVITGGEDDKIAMFPGHSSSIRAIACGGVLQSSESLHKAFLLFTAGGQGIIKSWTLTVSNDLLENINTDSSVKPTDLTLHMNAQWPPPFSNLSSLGEAGRIMDIDVKSVGGTEYVLLVAYSTGSLQLIKYCTAKRHYDVTWTTEWHERCILSAQFVKGQSFFVSGATDGRVAVWRDNDTKVPCFVFDVHQSGVNGLSIVSPEENVYWIATGGDDNAVVVTSLAFAAGECSVQWQIKELGSHSSTTTDVHWINTKMFASVSADSRVCVWEVSHAEETPSLKLVDSRVTDIRDVHRLAPCPGGIVVAGGGLQLFSLN